MPSAAGARAAFQARLAAGAGAVVLAVVAPLGLASGEAVDLGAVALGARRSFGESHPLADVLVRLVALIPFGEVGVRAHALAAVAGIATLALLAWRRSEAGQPAPWYLAGVALLALSRPFLEMATIHPVAAIDLALFVAGVRLIGAVRASDSDVRAGLMLAFVCGLAAGAGWHVRAVLWPMGALLAARAFRRGQRWPSRAPLIFGAGTVPLLGALVTASAPAPTVAQVLARMFVISPHAPVTGAVWSSAAVTLGEDAGALALLVAAVGAWVLVRRPPFRSAVPALAWLAVLGAAVVVDDRAFARAAALAALVPPVAAGVVALSTVFGRARAAVALVIVVVVVLPAAWLGVAARLTAPGRRLPAELARRLDAAPPPLAASAVPPAPADTKEMAPWLRYRASVGPTLAPPRILPE